MKELSINDLSLVFGGSPVKIAGVVASYVVGREIIDPIYDTVRNNIVNTPIIFPISNSISSASPSWVSVGSRYIGSNSQYMPGSSYPTYSNNRNQSGSDYGDGCNYQ